MARKSPKQKYVVRGKIACRVNGRLYSHKHGDIVEADQLEQWAIDNGSVRPIPNESETSKAVKPLLKPPETVTE